MAPKSSQLKNMEQLTLFLVPIRGESAVSCTDCVCFHSTFIIKFWSMNILYGKILFAACMLESERS